MTLRTKRQNSAHHHHRPAAPAQGPSHRLRAMARALRQWWAEDRHYRPERRYMRG